MDNIFANANTTVVPAYKAKPVARHIDLMSDTLASRAYLERKAQREQEEADEIALEAVQKRDNEQYLQSFVFERQARESQLSNAIETFSKKTKSYLLKSILCELYSKSLVHDKDFVTEHSRDIGKLISDYVDENGGFSLIEEAAKKTKSKLLTKIKDTCNKTANKVCKRKIKEATECNDPNCLMFDLTDEEQKEFEYNKNEISPDEIADLVKSKVLTVVKDEKARQEKEDELKKDIEEELAESDEVTDEETAKEAVNRILTNKSPVEETTLFNALLRNCCMAMIAEKFEEAPNTIDDTDTTEDDMMVSGPIDQGREMQGELDMDTVLSEALAQYTLMEMLYTLRIEDYSHENIKKLTHKLIKPVTR